MIANPKQIHLSFRSSVVRAIVLMVVAAIVMVLCIINIKQTDEITYRELIASSSPTRSRDEPALTTKQRRENVRKAVILSEINGRRHNRVCSDHSDLVFSYNNNRSEAIEYLDEVSMDMQEELYYQLPDGRGACRQANGRLLVRDADPHDPASWVDTKDFLPMQRVRHLEASNAIYYWIRDIFAAEEVDLTHFFVPEHHLLDSWESVQPMMHGLAESVQFSVMDKQIAFQAYRLKMTLFSKEGLF